MQIVSIACYREPLFGVAQYLSSKWKLIVVTLAIMLSWQAEATADDTLKTFRLITGTIDSGSYSVGVGISSLVTIKLRPSIGIMMETEPSSGLLSSLDLLRNGQVQFALLGASWQDIGLVDDNIRSIATLSREGERSKQLLAHREVDGDTVYQITKVIFEDLDFLKHIGVDDVSLERALDDVILPVHPGAERYFMQANIPPLRDTRQQANAPFNAVLNVEPAALIDRPDEAENTQADGRSFVVFFDFDDATLDEEAAAVLDEIATLPEDVLATAKIWMAGFADTAGRALYNKDLGQRRLDAVKNGLLDRGFDVASISSAAFGESMPWLKTGDGQAEPRNRRVEIFVDFNDEQR